MTIQPPRAALLDADIPAAIARDAEVAASYVAKSLYDANSLLIATTDDTPMALTVGASSFVGRKASGGIAAMTASEAKAVLAIAESDVTNLTTDLAAKATDSLVVHLAGTETISGAKTFSAAVTFGGSTQISSAGNLGIGGAPSFKLDVQANTGAVMAKIRQTDSFGSILELAPLNGVNGARVTAQWTSGTGYLGLGGGINDQIKLTSSNHCTFAEGLDIDFGTATGTKIGTSSSQKLALWGATPIVRPAAITAPAATAATNVSPYGYSQAQADALVAAVRDIITKLQSIGATA